MHDLNRTEVKAKATVTLKQYATIINTKLRPHTKFEISTSNNIGDILRTRLF